MCTVVQKMQQIASYGAYKNEFMIVALAIVTVVMLIMSLFKERNNIKLFAKSGFAVDDFGDGCVRVTECPTELADCDVSELVAEIADKLSFEIASESFPDLFISFEIEPSLSIEYMTSFTDTLDAFLI